jgi:hypothetical protein
MKMKMTLAAIVAASLVGTPVVAQAAARTASPVEDSENIQGGWFIPALAIIAVLLGVWVLVDGGGDDLPTSP